MRSPLEFKPDALRTVTGYGALLRDIVLPKEGVRQVANRKARRRWPVKDRPRHTNDRAAIFFGEVASGTGSAVRFDCAEWCETHRGDSHAMVHGGARPRGGSVA